MWLLVSKTSDKTVENTDAGAAWTLLVHRTERLFQGKLPSGDFVLFFHSNWIYSLLISAHRFLDLQIYNRLVPLTFPYIYNNINMYPESRKTYHIHSTLVKIAIVKKKNSYPQELT